MQPIIVSQVINAEPGAVFERACDIAGAPGWIPGLLKIEGLTPGPLRAGTRWRETRQTPIGRKMLEITISAVDSGRGYTAEWELAGAEFKAEFEIEPKGKGSLCRLTTTIRARGLFSGGLLSLGRGSLRRAFQADIDALKKAAESRPGRA